METLVIEKSAMSGGQVLTTYEVDNYLGLSGINGFDLGMKFREHDQTTPLYFLRIFPKSFQIYPAALPRTWSPSVLSVLC